MVLNRGLGQEELLPGQLSCPALGYQRALMQEECVHVPQPLPGWWHGKQFCFPESINTVQRSSEVR